MPEASYGNEVEGTRSELRENLRFGLRATERKLEVWEEDKLQAIDECMWCGGSES